MACTVYFPMRSQSSKVIRWVQRDSKRKKDLRDASPEERLRKVWVPDLTHEAYEWMKEFVTGSYKIQCRDAVADDPPDSQWEKRAAQFAMINRKHMPIRRIYGIEFENDADAVYFKMRWY